MLLSEEHDNTFEEKKVTCLVSTSISKFENPMHHYNFEQRH